MATQDFIMILAIAGSTQEITMTTKRLELLAEELKNSLTKSEI